MKTRIALITYAVISLVALMLLLSRENIYVVAAVLLGILLLAHREVWSLIRYRRLPVIDERVRANLTGAMRLTGIFFFIASILMIIVLRFDALEHTDKGLVFSGQLVIVGIVYLLAYHYYDRVRPILSARALQWIRRLLITAGMAISSIALGIALHNMVSYWLGFEEGVFFVIALIVAPAVFVFSLLGCLGICLRGLFGAAGHGESR